MDNTPFPPNPPHHETGFKLRQLALNLMDAADCYEDGKGEEGKRQALKVLDDLRDLLN
jgi:hypothetical protein